MKIFNHLRNVTKAIMATLPQNISKLTPEQFAKFADSFDTVLSDCDGVLWFEEEVVKDSENVLNKFREMGKQVFFVTNNSTKTREELLAKCLRLGFKAELDDVVSTSYLAAEYLKNLGFDKKVYVIGTAGVIKELDRFGIRHTDIGADPIGVGLVNYIEKELKLDEDVGAVLAAFDDHFSYPKMLKAACYLNDPKCIFLATNSDERVPIRPNLVIPGTGSIIKCLETLSERKAFVVGKPNDYIKSAVIQKRGIRPERTLMIGDRCNTDILFGQRCGFQTLLVLTGVTSMSEVEDWVKSDNPELHELVPQTYSPKLGDLLPLMQNH